MDLVSAGAGFRERLEQNGVSQYDTERKFKILEMADLRFEVGKSMI